MYAMLFSYVGKRGVLCCRVGGRLDGPCRVPAIMAYLVPEQWQLRGWECGGRSLCLQAGSRELLTSVRTGHSSR
jgi:hypothetical protein